jgi:Transposase and inactivated derivatives, TnpA family
MPVEFLTDDEAAKYAAYDGAPSQADLERVFFLDDEDRALIDRRRGEHMKLGFGLQLVTVRWLGAFLEDPLDVPVAVLDFVSEQLGITARRERRPRRRRRADCDHSLVSLPGGEARNSVAVSCRAHGAGSQRVRDPGKRLDDAAGRLVDVVADVNLWFLPAKRADGSRSR